MKKTALSLMALLLFLGCSEEEPLDLDDDLLESSEEEPESLEQQLDLEPRSITALDLEDEEVLIDPRRPAYFILESDEGPIDLDALLFHDDEGLRTSLSEVFIDSPAVINGLYGRDALFLGSVPVEHVDELCERFQHGHSDGDLMFTEQETLVLGPSADGKVHAMCLMPAPAPVEEEVEDPGTSINSGGPDDEFRYGSGAYTVEIKKITCSDPFESANWPENGDEPRLYTYYDGNGGGQVWSANSVKGGYKDWPDRYVHFNNNSLHVLRENDGDLLGDETIHSGEACDGDQSIHFHDSTWNHTWTYDYTYRVYGPNCPCQDAKPDIYSYSNSTISQLSSSTVKSYNYYCSGGTQWRQAWGDVVRHETTYKRKYDISCEMYTYISQSLLSDCDKHSYGVAIGSPVAVGVCQPPPPPPNGGGDECAFGLFPIPC